MRNINNEVKQAVKRAGFTNVRYHKFKNVLSTTYKFYECKPDDTKMVELHYLLAEMYLPYVVRIETSMQRPSGFISIKVGK